MGALIECKISDMDIVLTCDPAISEQANACRTAITVVGMSPYSKIFLLDMWAGRQGDPAMVITRILDMASLWMPRCIGIEMVAYQKALGPYLTKEMNSRNTWYPIIELKPDRNTKTSEKKNQRIMSMQPYFRAGQVYIQKGMLDFIEEYETFPLGRTNDILDAMAYAVRLLCPKDDRRKPRVDHQLRELAREDPGAAHYWRKLLEKRGELEPQPDTLDDEMEEYESPYGVGELVQ